MKTEYKYRLLVLITMAIGLNAFQPIEAQTAQKFKFRKDHTFRIAQFTDIHWNNNSPKCAETSALIREILAVEKPDLAILTGDIVTDIPEKEGWIAVAKIFIDAKIPFAVTLGNHDSEREIKRDYIFELLRTLPGFVGEKGAGLFGCGNYTIPVKGSDTESVAAVLYCLDSNDYPKDKRIGSYDWIKFDQIEWYRKTSDRFTALNKKMVVPSLMFFHIPLIEFNNVIGKPTTVGIKNEAVASSEINSGMFASLVEKRDVMGLFVGHDHDNNYIGVDHDIALAYGQATGYDAYGKFERGSRIIELHEGEFTFNTWIRTNSGKSDKFEFPTSSKSADKNPFYIPATKVAGLKPGVTFNYYQGSFTSTAELATATILKTGTLKNISIEPAAVQDSFAFEFKAWLKIPKKGVYGFYTYSDDGSKLVIDGKEVVNNDGPHDGKRADGEIALDEGFHQFRLLYFEGDSSNELEVGFSSVSIRECKIPEWFLFTK